MKSLFGYNNVYIDGNSIYTLEIVKERDYLFNLFIELSKSYKNFNNYDFILFFQDKGGVPDSKEIKSKRKKVLIYLSDDSGDPPIELSKYYYLIFKVHLKDKYPNYNIYPFPLGYTNDLSDKPYIKSSLRTKNCFFSGNLNLNRIEFWLSFFNRIERGLLKSKFRSFSIYNDNIRKKLLKFKRYNNRDKKVDNSILRFTKSFASGFDKKTYNNYLYNSKIAFCPKGVSKSECFRHYEAMKAGCIIISDKLPSTWFYLNSPIIEIEDWRNIRNLIKLLLSDTKLLDELSLKTKEWYESHMSPKAIAIYMGNIIDATVI